MHDPEGSHYENPDEAKLNSLSSGRKKMKLLQIALERQNYTLAAHVLVYGLIKARVDPSRDSYPHKCHGKKSKPQRKE